MAMPRVGTRFVLDRPPMRRPEAARRRPDVLPDTNSSTRADRALGRIVAEIPAQQKLLREYARQQHLTLLREFIDVETAKQAGRSGSARCSSLRLRAQPIARVSSNDRFARVRQVGRRPAMGCEPPRTHFVQREAH
jgi:hypothetical protein